MAQFSIITRLCALGQRQGRDELRAAKLLQRTLRQHGLVFAVQWFETAIPVYKTASLVVDGKKIDCLGATFKSGWLDNNSRLISAFNDRATGSNINYNPFCPAISLPNVYNKPALAIARQDVTFVRRAKKISGWVLVSRYKYKSRNILVGNAKKPKNVVFAHYDSIQQGAVDNASGVAVMLQVILERPDLLHNALFVFAGNEELSFDRPHYWGRGFRVFEQKYKKLLTNARRIVVVDSLGNARTKLTQNQNILHLAFPLKNKRLLRQKTYLLCGSINKLMSVYHTALDSPDKLNKKCLVHAVGLLIKTLEAD